MVDWTPPRTWVDEETVTHTIMNTHVRDNLKYLKDVESLPFCVSNHGYYTGYCKTFETEGGA